MKIKKLGHCCLLIEIPSTSLGTSNGVRIMTDPGAPSYSGSPTIETNIDLILITHEHSDHLHIESLQEILKNNPAVEIITNTSVGALLNEAGISWRKVEEGESYEFSGVKIIGFGNTHAQIYEDFGLVQNTGYMIGDLCYPGDSFNDPHQPVDILALPVAGPWVRISDAIEYAKKIHPRIAFPVHDAMIKEFATFLYTIPEHFLSKAGIKFKKLEIGKVEEI